MLGFNEEIELIKDDIKVVLVNIGEGINGDFNENDEEDTNFLRFDVYVLENDDWEVVDDASYCTCISAESDEAELNKHLNCLMKNFYNVLPDYSHGQARGVLTVKFSL